MNDNQLDLSRVLNTSWEAIRAYPGPAIGGFALYYVMVAGMQFIPILGFFAHIFVSPPLMGGLSILTLNTVDRRDPQIANLFEGFRAYGKWMGVTWLYYAVTTIALAPFGVVALIVYFAFFFEHRTFPPGLSGITTIGIISFAGAALIAVAIAVLIRWALVFYAGVESPGTLEAFGLSSQITRGHRLQFFWMYVVLGLIMISGVVALGVGLIFTIPFGALAMAALYRQLRPLSEPQILPLAPEPEAPVAPPPYTAIAPESPAAEMPRLPESEDAHGRQ